MTLRGVSLAALLLASCSDPSADMLDASVSTPKLRFMQADATGSIVELDPTDGFPVAIEVCSEVASLDSPLTAHVWIELNAAQTAPSVTAGTVVTDLPTVVLDSPPSVGGAAPMTPDGGTQGSCGVATLNAAGPGPVTVAADVAGIPVTISGRVGPDVTKLLAAQVASLTNWTANETTPRFEVCVESVAAKGQIQLSSDDTALLGTTQMPLTGALLPGPCSTPQLGGLGITHTTFDLTYAPPSAPPTNVTATLVGRPVNEDPTSWSVSTQLTSEHVAIALDQPVATGAVSATGTAYTVTAHTTLMADSAGDSILPAAVALQGVSVSFTATPMGASATPGMVTSDALGKAVTTVFVPYNTSVVLEASANGVSATPLVVTGDPVPQFTLSTPSFSQTGAATTGTLYSVSTNVTVDGQPWGGGIVNFSAQGTGVTVTPTTVNTTNEGLATTTVFVPYGAVGIVFATSGMTTVDGSSPYVAAPYSYSFTTQEIATSPPTYAIQGQVVDAANVPVAGVPVSFAEGAVSGVGATIAPMSTVSNTDGEVEADIALTGAPPMSGSGSNSAFVTATAFGIVVWTHEFSL